VRETKAAYELEELAEIGIARLQEQSDGTIDLTDRNNNQRDRRSHDQRRPSHRAVEGFTSKRPTYCGTTRDDPHGNAKKGGAERIMFDNPPVKEGCRAIDDEAGEDHIGQKMGSLGDAAQPDNSAEAESGNGGGAARRPGR